MLALPMYRVVSKVFRGGDGGDGGRFRAVSVEV